VLYPSETKEGTVRHPQTSDADQGIKRSPHSHHVFQEPSLPLPQQPYFLANQNFDSSSISDADLLLNLHTPYNTSSHLDNHENAATATSQLIADNALSPFVGQQQQYQDVYENDVFAVPYGSMMIESQDIDMSAVMTDDLMWLEYLPHDLMDMYDPGGASGTGDGVE
jgi:hypothetical protein